MAGPGIRYHYMAEVLAKDYTVTVGFLNDSFEPEKSFARSYQTKVINPSEFKAVLSDVNIIIALWLDEDILTYCHKKGIFTVLDVYAPVPVENLALFMYSGNPIDATTDYTYRQSYALYKKFFEYGDLFLFSNRRQLDFWIGYVFGLGIIKVTSYLKRPLFERFIYAPMGIDTSKKITHKKNVIKGVIPGIKKTDKVILWTGGIWNWFDAQTLIKAMKRLEKTNPDIKLVFFGIKHPNPNIPTMQEASLTIDLAKELELLGKNVFIQEGWVPYNERLDYLLEADAAVNTAKESIEAEFSHRTRVLDHILTSLPTIATRGDYISDDILEQRNIGLTVPPEDEAALSRAIIAITESTTNKAMRKNINALRKEYDWTQTLRPLLDTLATSPEKLSYIETKPHKELKKNTKLYRVAKKVTPVRLKKLIIKVTKYGQ